jgi:hypothetical protein
LTINNFTADLQDCPREGDSLFADYLIILTETKKIASLSFMREDACFGG